MNSTELDTIPTGDLVLDASDVALERIEKQARAMQAAHQLGTALASTKMVPDIYQGKPDDATAAILYGAELGFSAVQSLQNIFIVRGKPAVYSRSMVAQVLKAGHIVEEVEATPDSVTWRGVRADTGSVFESMWTIDRAKTAGFTSNKLYQSMPIEMLRAKAQAEVCRSMAPDVLLGMAHSVEDLQTSPIDRPERTPSRRIDKPTGAQGARAALGLTTEPEPAADPATDTPAPATPEQLQELAALLDAEGLTEGPAKLAWLTEQFGRDITSATDLTATEANDVTAFLKEDK